MYLPPISLESAFNDGLAAILNLTSRPSEVKSDFPPHLEINIRVYTNCGKKFMFFLKSAQLFCLAPLLLQLVALVRCDLT